MLIQARTGVDIQVRTSPGAGNFYTLKSGAVLELGITDNVSLGVIQPQNVWIRSASSTPVVEVIGFYGG